MGTSNEASRRRLSISSMVRRTLMGYGFLHTDVHTSSTKVLPTCKPASLARTLAARAFTPWGRYRDHQRGTYKAVAGIGAQSQLSVVVYITPKKFPVPTYLLGYACMSLQYIINNATRPILSANRNRTR